MRRWRTNWRVSRDTNFPRIRSRQGWIGCPGEIPLRFGYSSNDWSIYGPDLQGARHLLKLSGKYSGAVIMKFLGSNNPQTIVDSLKTAHRFV